MISPEAQILMHLALQLLVFEICCPKIGNALNDPKLNLNTKQSKVFYTPITYPWRPHFGPFRSTISRFRDTTCTRSAKIRNAPNDPNWSWTLSSQKYSRYTNFLPLRPKFWSIFLRTAVFKIKGQKSEMHWMTSTELQHLTVKNTLYTIYLSLRPKFWSVLLNK